VKAQCTELTSKLSYGDTSEEYHRLTGLRVPKSTIHGFTQEIAPDMLNANLNAAAPTQPQKPVILADGTEVRSVQRGEFNQVRIAIGVDGDSKQLLNLTVNRPYQNIPKDSILISDGEPSLKNQEPWRHQLCILHAIKRLMLALWREHASKIEREYLKAELERIIYTLINSTRKHASDGDHEALRRRIESTLSHQDGSLGTLFWLMDINRFTPTNCLWNSTSWNSVRRHFDSCDVVGRKLSNPLRPSRKKLAVTSAEFDTLKPIRNPLVEWQKSGEHDVEITVPRPNSTRGNLAAKVFVIPERKKYKLDEIGEPCRQLTRTHIWRSHSLTSKVGQAS
jgi:hypothetical protein